MFRKLSACVLVAFLLFTSTNAHAFKVIGYFISWGESGFEETLNYEYLTHINYSFILPTHSGGISPTFGNTYQLDRLVQLAHNNNVKVLISVGGWNNGDDSAFNTISSSSGLRTTFINNIMNFVSQHNLDGVDIDWEFPGTEYSDRYTTLMAELSTRLKASGKLLTAAVWGWNTDGVAGAVYDHVDFLNLMAYDGGVPHSTYAMAESSLNYWKNRGLPKEKMNLGIPFYGSNSGWDQKNYSQLVAWDSGAPYKDEGGYEMVNGYYYNSIETVKDKTILAAEQAGGVMFWALNLDTAGSTSLLNAVHQVAPPIGSSSSLTVSTASLASGTAGATYGPVTLAAAGGSAPYSWSIASGSLPAGLSLAQSTGIISGVPSAPGTFAFTIRCTDAGGMTGTKAFSLAISAGTAKVPSYPTGLTIN
ncbi:MAG: glycosyl hydrolase family 18 protein [Thermodesulfobacteriota bacterium]